MTIKCETVTAKKLWIVASLGRKHDTKNLVNLKEDLVGCKKFQNSSSF